jgi:hypothetical protein
VKQAPYQGPVCKQVLGTELASHHPSCVQNPEASRIFFLIYGPLKMTLQNLRTWPTSFPHLSSRRCQWNPSTVQQVICLTRAFTIKFFL